MAVKGKKLLEQLAAALRRHAVPMAALGLCSRAKVFAAFEPTTSAEAIVIATQWLGARRSWLASTTSEGAVVAFDYIGTGVVDGGDRSHRKPCCYATHDGAVAHTLWHQPGDGVGVTRQQTQFTQQLRNWGCC